MSDAAIHEHRNTQAWIATACGLAMTMGRPAWNVSGHAALTRPTGARTSIDGYPMSRSLESVLPKLVVAPGFVLGFAFIYGFMIWNGALSLTTSRMLPNYNFQGFEHYAALWQMDRWWVALANLGIFGLLYVGGSILIGLALAILLDQKVRAEGALRTIYLYPICLLYTSPSPRD